MFGWIILINMNIIDMFLEELKEFRYFFYRKIYYNPKNEREIITRFHRLFYGSGVMKRTYWFGTLVQKYPLDLWVYQEILHETKPDVVIECGTDCGGSTLFLANMMDLMNHGEIISIDIVNKKRPKHKRISYLLGSSTNKKIVDRVKNLIKDKKRVMVILDSDHSRDYVLKELEIYNHLVTTGDYLIVEDSNINGHPVHADSGPGPMEAINQFLKHNTNFKIDKSREKYYITCNPCGFLRKIRG